MLSGCTIGAWCLAVATGFTPSPRWTRLLWAALAIDVLVVAVMLWLVVPRP